MLTQNLELGKQRNKNAQVNNMYWPLPSIVSDCLNPDDLTPAQLINHFLPWLRIDWEITGETKKQIGRLIRNSEFDLELLDYVKAKQECYYDSLAGQLNKKAINAELISPLLLGSGQKNALEFGLLLHPTYCIPYIPGSSIKGLVSQVAYWEGAEEAEQMKVFGTQDQQGLVEFMDAYPHVKSGQLKLREETLTTHYTEYYMGDTPPAPYLEPNPVMYFTLKEGCQFTFRLVGEESQVLETAEKWLKIGLADYGIGAKTSLGFGRFMI